MKATGQTTGLLFLAGAGIVTSSGAHPASYPMHTGSSYAWDKVAEARS